MTPVAARRPVTATARPEPLSETALAWALIAGEPRAAEAAWTRYAPMVNGMLRRAFGSDHRVEDLTQDVFFILFRKVRGLREPNALKAYVITITAMTIKYELRRKRMMKQLCTSDALARVDRLTTEQPDATARAALVGFYAVLERLNESDRKAFILRFFEGLGVIEVALALDVSVSTAKRRLVRLRRRVSVLIRNSPALLSFLEGLEAVPSPTRRTGDQKDAAWASCWISAESSARL